MAEQKATHPAAVAVNALASELAAVRAERDLYRRLWLRQVDLNDKLRAQIAHDASMTMTLEAMGRE